MPQKSSWIKISIDCLQTMDSERKCKSASISLGNDHKPRRMQAGFPLSTAEQELRVGQQIWVPRWIKKLWKVGSTQGVHFNGRHPSYGRKTTQKALLLFDMVPFPRTRAPTLSSPGLFNSPRDSVSKLSWNCFSTSSFCMTFHSLPGLLFQPCYHKLLSRTLK